MSVFYVMYYHIIWGTKYRQPFITRQLEPVIFYAIQDKSRQFKAEIHGLNAVDDHVHVAVTIPPAVAVFEWVREVKGLSAHEVNRAFTDLDTTFKWQGGYSVLTFGKKVLPFVVNYILNQKQHHQQQTTLDYLEYLEHD